jgi:hypothetical protein
MAHSLPSSRLGAQAWRLLLVSLVLLAPRPSFAINFTEIMYYPPGSESERVKLKYIEIFNDHSTTVDLSGYHFAAGVVFTFPPKTLLGGRMYLVLCADEATVRSHYGITNTIGNFKGNLSEDGDKLVLYDQGGGLAAKVDFRDRGSWTSVPTGTGYSLSLINPFAENGQPGNWLPSRHPGGTPGAENFPAPYLNETQVFGETSDWVYKKGWNGTAMAAFSDPPDAWKAPGFDDSSFTPGKTPLGFGLTGLQTTLDDMNGNYLSFSLRKRFTLGSDVTALVESAALRIRVDDGYVAYLNGVEIGRLNVGTDAQVAFDKAATSSRSLNTAPVSIPITKEKLVQGENVLAVEVHNAALTSSANHAGIAPSLVWLRTIRDDSNPPVPVRINEVLRVPGSGPGGHWLELYNMSDTEVTLDGFHLTDDPAQPAEYTFPAGQTLAARGFVTLAEEDLKISLAGDGATRELRLYLIEADGATVADAVILEMNVAGTGDPLSQARIPDGSGDWFLSTTPSPGARNAAPLERDVILNEVMYHPLSGATSVLPSGATLERGEYVELYNRSDRTISLDGWGFTKGYNYFFPAGTQIGPGAYLVVGPDPDYLVKTYNLPASQVFGPTADPRVLGAFGTLANSGETIQLSDPLGNPVQEVRYSDGGEWPGYTDGGGSSLELIDPWQDNTVASAWDASDESSRAVWTQYSYTAPNVSAAESEFWVLLLDQGECLIDDISIKNGATEYVPNGGFEAATTAPWRITGTHIRSKRITSEFHSGTACLQIIASAGGDNRVNHIETDTSPRMPTASVTVSFWARWLKGSSALHTCAWNNNALGMTHALVVPPDLGTPGRENSVRARLRADTGSDNLGPVASQVRHLPAVPGPASTTTILARISDPDGVKEASVEYRLGRKSAVPATVPLLDDGQHGDGEAGDGLYGAFIPPQANLSKVLYDIVATDSGGRIRRFPADAPAHTLLFQVGDTYDSQALRYRLVLDDDNLQTLTTRLLHSDDLVDGSFIFEESEIYYNVGVRYHGSPWNRPPDPKMFAIHFPGEHNFRGYGKINISRYASAPNEATAYQLCRLATGGEAARTPYSPRYTFTKFYYNGRPHAGSSAMGEIIPPGSDYIKTMFPNDSGGYAYKLTGKLEFSDTGDFTNVTWTAYHYYGPTKESYRYFYNPSSREGDDEFSQLIQFLTIMDPAKTPLAKFEDPTVGIESICNVEAFLRIFAIRALQDDWDTVGIQNGQNSFLYYAPKEGKFYLLPWDMDHTFGDANARLAPSELSADAAVHRWLNDSPKYRRVYLRILKEFLGGFWSSQAMSPWLDAVANEMKGGLVASPSGIKSFMTSRVAAIRGRLPQLSKVIPFAITIPAGGKDFAVKSSQATITGTAPLELTRMVLARSGQDPAQVEPTWTGTLGTDWKLTLNLDRGKNSFQIFGFTGAGTPVGTININIYDATDWAAPVISSVDPSEGPTAGGTAITIKGQGFQEGVAVTVGGAAATAVALHSDTELVATTPAATVAGPAAVQVQNLDSQNAVLSGGFTYQSPIRTFIRGDVDGSQSVDITDPILLLNYQFLSGSAPACAEAADADDTGAVDLSDPIYLIQYLFLAGPQPPPPFPDPGTDPTADSLGC